MKDMGMTGLATAWAMARRRTKEYRHKVDAMSHCFIDARRMYYDARRMYLI